MPEAQPQDAKDRALFGDTPLGRRYAGHDWTGNPLGPPSAWPAALRSTVSLMMRAPHAMCVAWGPGRRFFCNDAYGPLLGKREAAAVGASLPELWPDIWADIEPLVDKAFAGEASMFDKLPLTMTRHGVEEQTWWRFSYSPIADEVGEVVGMLCVTSEVTKQAKAEAAAAELTADLERKVAERTAERDVMWRVSRDMLLVADREGVLQDVSPSWTRILGWERQELLGRTTEWIEHPEDRERTRAEVARMAAEGSPSYDFVNRFRAKGGAYRTVMWSATPVGDTLFCTGRDVTEEAEALSALSRSEAQLRSVVETTHLFQGLLDLDGTVVNLNATALEGIGSRRDEVVGKPLWESPWFGATPKMAEFARKAVDDAARGASVAREMLLRLPAGERWFDFRMRPLRGEDGHAVGLVAEAADITERRVAEDALRQAQKMEAVGQLTGGLAHDFNNLLASIGGSLQLLKARLGQGKLDGYDRYVGMGEESVRRAAALTQRLLAFSRRQTLDPKPIDINRLVAGMEELIRRTVGPAVELEVVGAGRLWTAKADAGQLENSLLNLCINARDAMPDGGRLTIETANRWLDDRAASVFELAPGQYVCLSITDTGIGMEPDVARRAFDPFFTTKPIGQGTGLGLSMVYGFARQSGGQVRVYSEVGKGTTMSLYFPRHDGEAKEDGEAPAPPPIEAGEGETVMIVEDEESIRYIAVEALAAAGYRVVEAGDGPAALRMLQKLGRIDLLVTDVGLPGGLNGRQVADAARVARPWLKVLFITGYADNAAVGNGHLERGMAVLTKPFELAALANKVRALLDSP